MSLKEKEKEAKGVDRVTDFVAEDEVDSEQAKESLSKLQATLQTTNAIIAISQEDIAFVAEECEITAIAAEHLLRRNEGNLQKALTAFVTGES